MDSTLYRPITDFRTTPSGPLGEGLLGYRRYAGGYDPSAWEEHNPMVSNPQSLAMEASLSRLASGALSLQDDFDRTRVGSVEIAIWTDAAHGTGGISVKDPTGTWAKHFALPATIITPLLAAVFQPAPEPIE